MTLGGAQGDARGAGGSGGGPGALGGALATQGVPPPQLTCSPCSLATCLLCSSSALFPMRIFWTPSGAY